MGNANCPFAHIRSTQADCWQTITVPQGSPPVRSMPTSHNPDYLYPASVRHTGVGSRRNGSRSFALLRQGVKRSGPSRNGGASLDSLARALELAVTRAGAAFRFFLALCQSSAQCVATRPACSPGPSRTAGMPRAKAGWRAVSPDFGPGLGPSCGSSLRGETDLQAGPRRRRLGMS